MSVHSVNSALTATIEHSRPGGLPARVHFHPVGCDSFTASGGLSMTHEDACDYVVVMGVRTGDPHAVFCRECVTYKDVVDIASYAINGTVKP